MSGPYGSDPEFVATVFTVALIVFVLGPAVWSALGRILTGSRGPRRWE